MGIGGRICGFQVFGGEPGICLALLPIRALQEFHLPKNKMAKNRKAQSSALLLGAVIKAFLICFLVGGLGVAYVWQRGQIDQLGKEIKEREIRLAELQRKNKSRADQLATLISPPALDARVKQLNLGLAQPPLSQIVRLSETESWIKDTAGAERLLTQAGR